MTSWDSKASPSDGEVGCFVGDMRASVGACCSASCPSRATTVPDDSPGEMTMADSAVSIGLYGAKANERDVAPFNKELFEWGA